MPAKSKKQLKFMQAVAHNKKFAKKVGVPQKVGKEFTKETKVKKYRRGGMPSMKELKDTADEIRRRDMSAREKLRRTGPMAEGMAPSAGVVGPMGRAGMPPMMTRPRQESRQLTPEEVARMDEMRRRFRDRQDNITRAPTTPLKKGGKVKKGYHKMPDGKIMKNSAHKKTAKCTRGDGCVKKGKTKGRMV